MSYSRRKNGPDIIITISGLEGSGKSCLMGDIAAMLELYGCDVRCFKQSRRSKHEQPLAKPAEGHFNELRNIKIVEME